MTRDEVRTALLKLPEDEREELALEIFASAEDVPVSAEWMNEVRRRDREIQEGKVVPRDSDQVFADAFKRLNAKS